MSLARRVRGWAGNARRVVTTDFSAPNPVTVATVAAVDRAWNAGISGHTGTIIAGDSADPGWSYNGYFPQDAEPSFTGATTGVVRNPLQALPATAGPVSVDGGPSSVADMLRNLGGGPVR